MDGPTVTRRQDLGPPRGVGAPAAGEQAADSGSPRRGGVNWRAWHAGYEDPESALAQRLALVQAQIRGALDRAPAGPIRVISMCAGQGQDLIGVLAEHPRRGDVSARLVELDMENVRIARAAASAAGLDGVEVLAGDASRTNSYAGAVPADVILICGLLGNISSSDIAGMIGRLGQLCTPGAVVIWTRHCRPPDLVPYVREHFEGAGFAELAFTYAPPSGVGAHRLLAQPQPLQRDLKLFDFIGHEALWPHLGDRERSALGALFRPDCSLVELVDAMRALPCGLPSDGTVESMLIEARGTSAAKHMFLGQLLAQRFPQTEPVLMHRVYRLQRPRARTMFGHAVAETVPPEGLIDVHRYLIVTLEGRRVGLDATTSSEPWDRRSPLELACGPGRDHPAGADPDADMRALEREYCDASLRGPFLAALAAAAKPPGGPV